MNAKRERERILDDYRIDSGIIRDAGKFVGEPIYVPYFWSLMMDEQVNDEYEDDRGSVAYFEIEADEYEAFPELGQATGIEIWSSDDGLVYSKCLLRRPHESIAD